jgi:hypothetical protein
LNCYDIWRTRYIFLVSVIQTLLCFGESSSVGVDVNCYIDSVLNAGRQLIVRTSANEDAIIEAVAREW